MHAGLDWSNFEPTLTPELAASYRDELGITRFLVQTQFSETFQPAAAACLSAQIGLDAVRYLYNDSDFSSQIQQALDQIGLCAPAHVRYLDLDVEDEMGDTSGLPDRLYSAVQSYQGLTPLRIYSSPGFWASFMLDDTRIAALGIPLRLAEWDGLASLGNPHMGGWPACDAKQYSGGLLALGVNVNPNVCADSLF